MLVILSACRRDEAVTGDMRGEVIATVGDRVLSLRKGAPVTVAIEGRSAAGKSTFGDELAEALRLRNVEAIRASIDDFHRPNHKYGPGQDGWTPRRYYDEGYDYEAFRELVLDPIAPGGSRRCRTAYFDAFHNEWYAEEWHVVSDDAVVIVDGIYLLRPEFADRWDLVIWLDIEMETMVERAKKRDSAWAGSEAKVEQRYRSHWIPTHELYEQLHDPMAKAQIVIDNRNLDEPRIVRGPIPVRRKASR